MTSEIASKFSRPRRVFPGIVRDARKLRVSREHLWMVLTGRRQSPKLLKRYELLKHKQENQQETV